MDYEFSENNLKSKRPKLCVYVTINYDDLSIDHYVNTSIHYFDINYDVIQAKGSLVRKNLVYRYIDFAFIGVADPCKVKGFFFMENHHRIKIYKNRNKKQLF